jgi:hypothetical protein
MIPRACRWFPHRTKRAATWTYLATRLVVLPEKHLGKPNNLRTREDGLICTDTPSRNTFFGCALGFACLQSCLLVKCSLLTFRFQCHSRRDETVFPEHDEPFKVGDSFFARYDPYSLLSVPGF